ncbi:NTP transferase domain-containing protein [Croceitalea rosinachiae]|uniref:NTP transferase domain-containing protein n=1 Tax=Croceitalea rosinachiae TaxID=3075596 RepID=A0ABU3ADH4_9FLAO|nr:NTP transferase domain-containing protein [Croceitalea sp. F388]MDT0607562.1 NTP transferase domain-containing protein [Croceitalea sp. F388]
MGKTKLYGLILSGGKSTRMGNDKGLITYYDGIPQREYMYQLAEQVCDKTFLSIRSEQEDQLQNKFDAILDEDEYRGPLNGILSAHKAYPKIAWLVLACDLPLLNQKSLRNLVVQRDTNKAATAYATKESGLPEPLAAIWEPFGLQKAIAYMQTAGSSCPRKFLINSDVKLIFPKTDEVLFNANSLSEYEFAKSKVEDE